MSPTPSASTLKFVSSRRLRARAILAATAGLAASGAAANAQPITSIWEGAFSNNWSNALNWSPQVVPDNAGAVSYHVVNDGGYIICNGDFGVNTVTQGAAGVIDVPNGFSLGLDSNVGAANDGLIRLLGVDEFTELFIDGAYVFGGTGALEMTDLTHSRITSTFGSEDRIINGSGHTIRGAGQFAAGAFTGQPRLTNHGLINANIPGGGLWVRVGTSSSDLPSANDGVLRASNGGILIVDGSIDNTGGVIEALDGSRVDLRNDGAPGNGVASGELRTEGSGEFQVIPGFHSTLHGVTNSGLLGVPDDSGLYLTGAITNDGLIELRGVENDTWLYVLGAEAVLGGDGMLFLGEVSAGTNRINGIFAQQNRLINGPEHTIAGAGSIGWANGPNLTNQGLIDASVPGAALDIEPSGSEDNFNEGVMQASNGGILRFDGRRIVNTGGLVRALDGSEVRLLNINGGNAKLLGGELATEGTGTVRFQGQNVVQNVLSNATINQDPGAETNLAGSFTNNGTYTLLDPDTQSIIFLQNDVTLEGTGEIVMQKASWPPHRIESPFGETWTLTNGAQHTIRGAGRIGLHNMGFINMGTVRADTGASIRIEAIGSIPVENHGTLEASNASILQVRDADFTNNSFTNHGTIAVEAESEFRRVGGGGPELVQVAGETVVGGELVVDQFVRLEGGELRGTGLVTTPLVTNLSGAVAPGDPTGTLSLSGDYTQGEEAALRIELGSGEGATSGTLAVQGQATLAGALDISFEEGFVPDLCESFTILTAGSIEGQFDSVATPSARGLKLDLVYGEKAFEIVVTCAGDFNGDCAANVFDFVAFQQLFQQQDPKADCNEDGEFDAFDFVCFQVAFQEGCE